MPTTLPMEHLQQLTRMQVPEMRDYQAEINQATFEVMQRHQQLIADNPEMSETEKQWLKRIGVQCATGSGKSEMAIDVLSQFLKLRKDSHGNIVTRNVIWMTDRHELRKQSGGRLLKYNIPINDIVEEYIYRREILGGCVNLISPGVRKFEHLWEQCGPQDLLVVDEFHHAVAPSWLRKIMSFPGYVIGYSATPARSDPKQGFDKVFSELVQRISIPELVEQEWLSPFQIFIPKENRRVRPGREIAGDYDPDDVMHVNRREIYLDLALDYWKEIVEKRVPNALTLVYCLNRIHALNFSIMLADQGYRVGVVMSDITPPRRTANEYLYQRRLAEYEDMLQARDDALAAGVVLDREEAFERFKFRELQFLVNVNVVSEGADIPDLDAVLITRPTKSPTLFLQMVGRVLRISEGKEYGYILDLPANSDRLGRALFDADFRWDLKPRNYGDEDLGGGFVPKEPCPGCEARYFPIPRHPHYCKTCGFAFGRPCINGCGEWRWLHDWRSEDAEVCNPCVESQRKAEPYQTGKKDIEINVDVKSSDDMIGVDKRWRKSSRNYRVLVTETLLRRFAVMPMRGGHWTVGYILIEPKDPNVKEEWRHSEHSWTSRDEALEYAEAFIARVEAMERMEDRF